MDFKRRVLVLLRSQPPFWFLLALILIFLAAVLYSYNAYFSMKSGMPSGAGLPVVKPAAKPVFSDQDMLDQAEGLYLQGRVPEAVVAYEKLIETRPKFAEPYFRLGMIYFHLGLKSKSEEAYLKAIELDFKNPEIYFHLGYIKESEGKLQDALEWYLKAEERGVASAELYFNLGNVFARLDNKGNAVAYYTKAVVVNPRHMDSYINLSIISFHLQKFVDAKFYLDKAAALGYKPPDEYVALLASKLLEAEPRSQEQAVLP
jgi:tetratricopeptide (TPR) repeat protein